MTTIHQLRHLTTCMRQSSDMLGLKQLSIMLHPDDYAQVKDMVEREVDCYGSSTRSANPPNYGFIFDGVHFSSGVVD